MRIRYREMEDLLRGILLREGFSGDKADFIAGVHTRSTCDGVASHGINRFPLFIEYVRKRIVDPHAEPECLNSSGFAEQWEGHMGSGVWNAHCAMVRCIEIAGDRGIGIVTLRNTNHWMRGGTYGWQAANSGLIGICFTNTKPNMPAWGAADVRIGNNPLVIAIPRKNGHVVVDMSMSQFSYGAMQRYLSEGRHMPVQAGWDRDGVLTNDPAEIIASERPLPAGLWKGSALAVVLDLLATLLSGGLATHQIGLRESESALSQVFICLDPGLFAPEEERNRWLNDIIEDLHRSVPMEDGMKILYPGERVWETRMRNLREGIPVDPEIWEKITEL